MSKRLWLLRPVEGYGKGYGEGPPDDPWEPWFDKAFGFVVRAETEQEAREFAEGQSGNESPRLEGCTRAWRDPNYSTCEELDGEGKPGVILQDFHAA